MTYTATGNPSYEVVAYMPWRTVVMDTQEKADTQAAQLRAAGYKTIINVIYDLTPEGNEQPKPTNGGTGSPGAGNPPTIPDKPSPSA